MLRSKPNNFSIVKRDHAAYNRTDEKYLWQLRGLINNLKRSKERTRLYPLTFQEGSSFSLIRQIRVKRR